MALIFLRIEAKLPVILLGETGIGKTALLKLLSNIMMESYFRCIDIYSGMLENDIIHFINKC